MFRTRLLLVAAAATVVSTGAVAARDGVKLRHSSYLASFLCQYCPAGVISGHWRTFWNATKKPK